MKNIDILGKQSQCHPEWPISAEPRWVYRRVNGFWKCALLFLLICNSCTNYDGLISAVKASDKFVENYADEFLENEGLLQYTYNPRIQFFHDGNDSDDYMVFVRPNGFSLMCHTNCCLIDDKFGKTEPVYLDRGTYYFIEDTIITRTENDSIKNFYPDFKEGSILIFEKLKQDISRYGIMAFYRPQSKEYVQVHFQTKFYLLYMKDFNKMHQFGFEKDFLIKQYDKGWMLLKAERPLDLG